MYYTCSCENLNSNCIESPSKAVILLKSLATSPISFSPLRKAETKASNSGIIWACKKEEAFEISRLIFMSIHGKSDFYYLVVHGKEVEIRRRLTRPFVVTGDITAIEFSISKAFLRFWDNQKDKLENLGE